MRGFPLFAVTISVGLGLGATTTEPMDLFQAVRSGETAFLRAHISRTNVDARDRRGATLLMQATAFGSIHAMKALLDAGAEVNAKNDFGATALIWGSRDPAKARLLIRRGANVNARSKQGRTPLMMAASLDGGSSTVALLLAKGAEVNVKDSRGDSALGLAALAGDVESMRLLIAKEADVSAVNQWGETPIILASKSNRPEAVRLLLSRGVDVNVATTWYMSVRHGQVAQLKLTALHHAAGYGRLDTIRDLVKAGANVNARDSRGLAALTFAVAADHQNPETIRALIEAGADVNAADNTGETPLDWAEKFGYPEVIAALKNAGSKHGASYEAPKQPEVTRQDPAAALARSIELLQKSSAEFFKESGCVGCHHQPMAARAQRQAKAAGIRVDPVAAREQMLQLKAQWASSQEEFLQALNPGGGSNRLAENLLGLDAAGSSPDTITDPAVVDLAESQAADGSWPPGEEQERPPITEGYIAATARAIRALQVYSIPARKAEFAARIARARAWLNEAKPVSTDDFAMRLAGLGWSGAGKTELQKAARALLALQHADGGWSGNPYLKSDAFATGESLYALHESGSLRAIDVEYRRGVEYLLSTQYPDGSWYVRSRAIKFQPYFQSGFPFGDDQWISAAGTAWASLALAPAVEPLPILPAQ